MSDPRDQPQAMTCPACGSVRDSWVWDGDGWEWDDEWWIDPVTASPSYTCSHRCYLKRQAEAAR